MNPGASEFVPRSQRAKRVLRSHGSSFVCFSVNCPDTCPLAHSNTCGSIVKTAIYCVRGHMATCRVATCPFNHHRDPENFAAWRNTGSRAARAHAPVYAPVHTSAHACAEFVLESSAAWPGLQ